MAKDAFDFSDVFTDIENKINKFMSAEETKELLVAYTVKRAKKDVYGAYTPHGKEPYERRYSFTNADTYEVTTGRLSMTIESWAHGSGMAGNGLTDVVESGIGYEWEQSEIYDTQQPRPFMHESLNDFVDDYLLGAIHNTFFDD